MRYHNTFRRKLFIYYFSVFFLFGLILMAFQYSREKRYKTDELESSLDQIAGITHQYINSLHLLENGKFYLIDSLHRLIPNKDTRITIISTEGDVYYDSSVEAKSMENHLRRPEIQKALYNEIGGNIRESATTGLDYYYFAHYFPEYFVRIAVQYDIEIKNLLQAEGKFWIVFIVCFVIIWFVLGFVTRKTGDAITKLKEFAILARKGQELDQNVVFPDNELGIISREIIDMYKRINDTKNELVQEKDRLISHLSALNEGVSLFSKDKKDIYHNNNFIQYINLISESPTISSSAVFGIPEFSGIIDFLEKKKDPANFSQLAELPRLEYVIHSNGRYFKVQSVIFADQSFEINITDVTRPEKRRIIKQQITANIAHELKTPVSSVKGYLETLINNPDLDEEKRRHFIDKAFAQSERLTDLINDIVVLNKIEETSEHFEMESVDIEPILKELAGLYAQNLTEKKMGMKHNLSPDMFVRGNRSLIFAIFQNLLENSINYAGEGSQISINLFLEDNEYYHFSFLDNGQGVKEQHLNRLFERFYRVDQGRTRKSGGTGLGLAIVKNAILLHKGEINVRKGKDGGLEFIFSLPKG